jgi:FKBP-type peptidyl-prolyl cis-trans isomerase
MYIHAHIHTHATGYGKEKPVSFVYINTLEDRSAARAFNVSCDYPCTFHVARTLGGEHETIEVKGQDEDIIKSLAGVMAPVLTKVNTEAEVEAFSKLHAVAVMALFKGKQAENSNEYKAVELAAKKLRGKVAVMWSDKGIGGVSPPEVRLWVNSSAPRSVQMSTDPEIMARNIVAMSWGFEMFNYTWSKRELFDSVQLPVAHVFLDDAYVTQDSLAMFSEAAKEMRGDMAFVRFTKKDAFMLKEFGLAEDQLPSFGIADQFAATAKRYGMEDDRLGPSIPMHIPDPAAVKPEDWNDDDDGEWEAPIVPNPEYTPGRRATRFSKKAILDFANDYLNGKLTPSYKSEPVPRVSAEDGQVRTVVWKSLKQQAPAGANEAVLLLLYKPWAESKDKVFATLDKVAEAFSNLPQMVVGKMDSSKNHMDTEFFTGFDEYSADPVVYLIQDGVAVRYKGPIAQADIFKYLAKNVQLVKSAWADKVKPQLKMMKEAAAEIKRKKDEVESAKRAKLEEEKKKIDELVQDAEKIDVSKEKDGGIIKQIIEQGVGSEKPTAGVKVKAHYTGTLMDGTEFDSSRKRGTPFEFELGKGNVIPCWDVGMLSMSKNERALLTCSAKNAYGERGAGNDIPANADLRFDVQLISWEGSKDEL